MKLERSTSIMLPLVKRAITAVGPSESTITGNTMFCAAPPFHPPTGSDRFSPNRSIP
jgi:hypothetical protein